ncbi:MAG: ATP/GTP-binding protein [Actinomycetia bacterium]|nr:ATP/GTP-binding protein [Actinomycetes bacterium]
MRLPAVGKVDEIHNLNNGTTAGADLSDHLKYFTEHIPATFVYAGMEVEGSGLFTGIRGKQIAGRCVLINTSSFPFRAAEWRSLVATLEGALRLHCHEPGTLVRHARYLHTRTGGMIGSLDHLIRAAATIAILKETEKIDLACSSPCASTTTRSQRDPPPLPAPRTQADQHRGMAPPHRAAPLSPPAPGT